MSWSCFSFIPSVFTTGPDTSNASDGNTHTSHSLDYTEPASDAGSSTLLKEQSSCINATHPGDPYSQSQEQPMTMTKKAHSPADSHNAESAPNGENEPGQSTAKSAVKAVGAGLAVGGCIAACCLGFGECFCEVSAGCVKICCG
jgi:hypothetical protein